MSTTVASMPIVKKSLPGRRYDRVFFPAMAVLILIAVFIGFAKTYFLAGMVRAHLPSWVVHVHGALFSTWVILFGVQTALVSGRRLDLHKKLGLFGFGLACIMVPFALTAARLSLIRGLVPPGFPFDVNVFFIIPVQAMFLFVTFVYFGWALRTDGATHKRLMTMATISLLGAAIGRWPFHYLQGGHWASDFSLFAFLFLLMGYDLWSTHKIHRATLWGSIGFIIVTEAAIPIALTPAWHHFANLVAGKV